MERLKSQKGQTLIETLAAVFILVMGITAVVGLSLFAYSSSTNITKQIIATGLAREGVEAVKNMRDTNWLKITAIDNSCYNYQSGVSSPNAVSCPGTSQGGACCYKSWLKPPGAPSPDKGFDISQPGGGKSLRLTIDPSSDSEFWEVKADTNNWGLNKDFSSDLGSAGFTGFYKVTDLNSGATHGTSDYYRKIIITEDATPPFNQNEFHRLKVISQVWWTDKKCPRVADWPGTGKCSVEIQSYLTNWKNY